MLKEVMVQASFDILSVKYLIVDKSGYSGFEPGVVVPLQVACHAKYRYHVPICQYKSDTFRLAA